MLFNNETEDLVYVLHTVTGSPTFWGVLAKVDFILRERIATPANLLLALDKRNRRNFYKHHARIVEVELMNS